MLLPPGATWPQGSRRPPLREQMQRYVQMILELLLEMRSGYCSCEVAIEDYDSCLFISTLQLFIWTRTDRAKPMDSLIHQCQ